MANESRLVLPKPMMAKLQSLGIYCQTWVTAERQDRAKRWVLRGVESGGSAKEFGRYISFFAADGSRMEWLQKADRIGANGVHAVAIGEALVGVEAEAPHLVADALGRLTGRQARQLFDRSISDSVDADREFAAGVIGRTDADGRRR